MFAGWLVELAGWLASSLGRGEEDNGLRMTDKAGDHRITGK
jgi:hypothetical protein